MSSTGAVVSCSREGDARVPLIVFGSDCVVRAAQTSYQRHTNGIGLYESKLKHDTRQPDRVLLQTAVRAILGEEALRYGIRR